MRKFLTRSIIVSLGWGLSMAPAFAAYGLEEAKGNLPAGADVPTMIGNVLKVVLGFTGTIFFVLVIYAGLMWMTAAGSEERIKKAKQILIAAVIGLIIILSAYAITKFIGGAFA